MSSYTHICKCNCYKLIEDNRNIERSFHISMQLRRGTLATNIMSILRHVNFHAFGANTAEMSENVVVYTVKHIALCVRVYMWARNVTIYSTNIRCDIRAVGFSCFFSSFSRRAICVLYWRCFVPGEKADGTLYSGRFASSHLSFSFTPSLYVTRNTV